MRRRRAISGRSVTVMVIVMTRMRVIIMCMGIVVMMRVGIGPELTFEGHEG